MSNSVFYNNYLMVSNFLTNSVSYLYETITTNSLYNYIKDKLLLVKNKIFTKTTDGLHVDTGGVNAPSVKLDSEATIDNE